MNTENKMGTMQVNKLIWTMGLPMILSMVLQAIYNVVDTIFVINSSAATQGNAALTAAFPIQILIIAIGVGTGVGINALLSRKLGEKDRKTLSSFWHVFFNTLYAFDVQRPCCYSNGNRISPDLLLFFNGSLPK